MVHEKILKSVEKLVISDAKIRSEETVFGHRHSRNKYIYHKTHIKY